jgi:N-acyl-L-homoserine lactone synthetase
MIEAFSLRTAHLFGDALASQARLRYRVFVRHRGLPHRHHGGMEYDEFDTPAAHYLVWRDQAAEVRGMFRLIPTTEPYMLEQNWPFLCRSRALPKLEEVWEIGRVCVDRTYRARERKIIIPELLCALHEFCQASRIRAVIGVTRQHLVSYYIPSGVEWLGEPAEIEGEQEAAFLIPAEHLRPEAHCAKLRIPSSVLSLESLSQRIAA